MSSEPTVRRVYLDYNGSTPIHPSVAEIIKPFLSDYFGNPSSLHWAGRDANAYLAAGRQQIADMIGVKPGEIVMESGGTESDNHAMKGAAIAARGRGNHIITTMIEHPAVLNTCRYLETRGFEVTYLPVDGCGAIDPGDVKGAIRKSTILISVMYANNETGNLLPVREIGKIAKDHGILFHSDMVQALGKVDVDVKTLNVDLASFSSHKVYAPKGTGVLYIREGLEIDTLIHGGHQEGSRRAGTENVMGAVAFGKACETVGRGMAENNRKVESLRTKLLEGITEQIEDVRFNGHPTLRLPNTLNLSFRHVEAESLLIALDLQGVAVSAGPACASGATEPSHVLRAMGIPAEVCRSAIRLSLGIWNTEDDIEYVLSLMPGVVARLRKMSPFYRR